MKNNFCSNYKLNHFLKNRLNKNYQSLQKQNFLLRKIEIKTQSKPIGKLNVRGLNDLKENFCSKRRSKKKINIEGARTPEFISIKLGVNNKVPINIKKKTLIFSGKRFEKK